MAIMTGKIQMRQGQEVNFDPDKMSPGEWAVSLDTKYIRMCFSPGVCIRMATYEAFEADMAQIKAILAEAKTVQSAVIRINNEVSDKLDAVVEYTGQAKTYRDQALQYRNDAERFRNETQQVAGGNFLTPESAVSFTEATSRSNITTTDTVKIILGKIKKFFTDLKPHAFSNPTNNLLATVAGMSLDAVQGKILNDNIAFKTISNKIYNFNLQGSTADVSGILSSAGMSHNLTFQENMNLLKNINAESFLNQISMHCNSNTSKFNTGLPVTSGGFLTIYLPKQGRRFFEFYDYRTGIIYTNYDLDGQFGSWTIQCTNKNYRMKSYSHWNHLGLKFEEITDLSTILKAMPDQSIFEIPINLTEYEICFEKKVIPTNTTGVLNCSSNGRGRVIYTTDAGDLYVLGLSNARMDFSGYPKWKRYTGTAI